MILRALYDYYQRCEDLAPIGTEYKEIAFVIVINKEGDFIRIEDTRTEEGRGSSFLVSASWGRTGITPQPFNFWDNCSYVLGISAESFVDLEADKVTEKKKKDVAKALDKNSKVFNAYVEYVNNVFEKHPDDSDVKAVYFFYQKNKNNICEIIQQDALWSELKRNLTKNISFRIEYDTRIVAAKPSIISYSLNSGNDKDGNDICLVTGEHCIPINTFSKIPVGKFSDTKLVSFQKSSGYDSYGKEQGRNAPISSDAEFKIATALKKLNGFQSHNRYQLGSRTFLFWASSTTEVSQKAEEYLFDFLGISDKKEDDANARIDEVREVFDAIYKGKLNANKEDRFYILGIYPANKARIAVCYWADISLIKFAEKILKHFDYMDLGKTKRPYSGLKDMLRSVSLKGDMNNCPSNLPDAVVKSIFQGLPYPQTLFASAIRRIRAEQDVMFYGSPCRIAIIKAYLNRLNDNNNKKIQPMLDKENQNQGYLCGRLFAMLERIQELSNKDNGYKSTIASRYMDSASSNPSIVFPTLLKLSVHHLEKIQNTKWLKDLVGEIMDKINIVGFAPQLDLNDQGRFFIGYYHQRQKFNFGKKEESTEE